MQTCKQAWLKFKCVSEKAKNWRLLLKAGCDKTPPASVLPVVSQLRLMMGKGIHEISSIARTALMLWPAAQSTHQSLLNANTDIWADKHRYKLYLHRFLLPIFFFSIRQPSSNQNLCSLNAPTVQQQQMKTNDVGLREPRACGKIGVWWTKLVKARVKCCLQAKKPN